MSPLRLLVFLGAVGLLVGDAGCSGQLTVGMFTSDAGSGASTGESGSTAAAGESTGASVLPACSVVSAPSTMVWGEACYPEYALPYGACTAGAATCSFCSYFECAGVPDQTHSPRVFYSCACDAGPGQGGVGVWNCVVVNQDASICPPPAGGSSAAEAGTDAGVSASSGSGSSGDTASSGSTSPVSPIAACDDYFAAQYDRGCGGPQLPPTEAARIRARFEQVCQNQYALPGSGVTPDSLEACALATEASPCELPDGLPAVCTFFGTLSAGAACNENFQCQSGVCQGTDFISTVGQIGPSTCGTCAMTTGSPWGVVQLGAACDGSTMVTCAAGLYCEATTGTCASLAEAGNACGVGSKPPGNLGGCAPPLSCVGSPGAASCSPLGATGALCESDSDCAPGLGCRGSHGVNMPASGTCEPLAWAGPDKPCDIGNTTNCLVGSCGAGPFDGIGMPSDGGPLPGLCPLVIADGQPAPGSPGPMANTYTTCDTFAEPFLANFHFMAGVPNGGAYGSCTLFDSVVCK